MSRVQQHAFDLASKRVVNLLAPGKILHFQRPQKSANTSTLQHISFIFSCSMVLKADLGMALTASPVERGVCHSSLRVKRVFFEQVRTILAAEGAYFPCRPSNIRSSLSPLFSVRPQLVRAPLPHPNRRWLGWVPGGV